MTFKFEDDEEGVIMFVTKINEVPFAIQFPGVISFSINHARAGVPGEVMNGIVALLAPEGKKYISLKGSEWNLAVSTEAATADRYEVPSAFMHHYADGKIVTALIEGIYQPALALRFAGESDFKVMYDEMSAEDRANYQSLLKSFDAPLRQVHKMFQVFDQKRKDFEKVNPFKNL